MQDLLAGRFTGYFAAPPTALPQIESAKLIAGDNRLDAAVLLAQRAGRRGGPAQIADFMRQESSKSGAVVRQRKLTVD